MATDIPIYKSVQILSYEFRERSGGTHPISGNTRLMEWERHASGWRGDGNVYSNN